MALAVPATSRVNMIVVQYWHMTKQEPMIPKKRRMKMVPTTATMELVQMSSFEIPMPTGSGSLIVDRRGVILNQQKNARKKEIHDTWNPRMWGRRKEFSLISVALQVLGSVLMYG